MISEQRSHIRTLLLLAAIALSSLAEPTLDPPLYFVGAEKGSGDIAIQYWVESNAVLLVKW